MLHLRSKKISLFLCSVSCSALILAEPSAAFAATSAVASGVDVVRPEIKVAVPKDYALPKNPTVLHGNVTHALEAAGKMLVTSREAIGRVQYDLNDRAVFVGKDAGMKIDQARSATFIMETMDKRQAQVLGQIQSQGSVVMAFPGGVAFKDGSVVDVANLTVVAGRVKEISNGKIHMMPNSAEMGALIVNEGMIKVQDGGLAAFVAPNAANFGFILAKDGGVYMGNGVDLYGDGLIKFNVSETNAKKSVEKAKVRAKDLGLEKGMLVLDTGEALDVIKGVVNTGLTQTKTAVIEAGTIIIGSDSTTHLGKDTVAKTNGGTIIVKGQTIGAHGALDASSKSGKGGDVFVGGTWHGGRVDAAYGSKIGINQTDLERVFKTTQTKMQNAKSVTFGKSARIDVSGYGDAGTAVIWSDEDTSLQGFVNLDSKTGRAGFFEGSGAKMLIKSDSFDYSNNAVSPGVVLFDPKNYAVIGGTAAINGAPWDATETDIYRLDPATIRTGETYTASDWILVQDPITLTAAGNLTLHAGKGVIQDGKIDIQGFLTMTSSGVMKISDLSTTNGLKITADQNITMNNSTILSPGKQIEISGKSFIFGTISSLDTTSISVRGGFIGQDGNSFGIQGRNPNTSVDLESYSGAIYFNGYQNIVLNKISSFGGIKMFFTGDIDQKDANSTFKANGIVDLQATGNINLNRNIDHGIVGYIIARADNIVLNSATQLIINKIEATTELDLRSKKILLKTPSIKASTLVLEKYEDGMPLTIGVNGFMSVSDFQYFLSGFNALLRHKGNVVLDTPLQLQKDLIIKAQQIDVNAPITSSARIILKGSEAKSININALINVAGDIAIDSDGGILSTVSGFIKSGGRITLDTNSRDIGSSSMPLNLSHGQFGYLVARSKQGRIYINSNADLVLSGNAFYYSDTRTDSDFASFTDPKLATTVALTNVFTKNNNMTISSPKITLGTKTVRAKDGELVLIAKQISMPTGSKFEAKNITIKMDSVNVSVLNTPSYGNGIVPLNQILAAWQSRPSDTTGFGSVVIQSNQTITQGTNLDSRIALSSHDIEGTLNLIYDGTKLTYESGDVFNTFTSSIPKLSVTSSNFEIKSDFMSIIKSIIAPGATIGFASSSLVKISTPIDLIGISLGFVAPSVMSTGDYLIDTGSSPVAFISSSGEIYGGSEGSLKINASSINTSGYSNVKIVSPSDLKITTDASSVALKSGGDLGLTSSTFVQIEAFDAGKNALINAEKSFKLLSDAQAKDNFYIIVSSNLDLNSKQLKSVDANIIANVGAITNGQVSGKNISIDAQDGIGQSGVTGSPLNVFSTGYVVMRAGAGGINIAAISPLNIGGEALAPNSPTNMSSSGKIKISTQQGISLMLSNSPSIHTDQDLEISASSINRGSSSVYSGTKNVTLKSLLDMNIDGFMQGSDFENLVNAGTYLTLDAGYSNIILKSKLIYRTGSLDLYGREVIFEGSIPGLYAIDAAGQDVIIGAMLNIDNNGKQVLVKSLKMYDYDSDTIISKNDASGKFQGLLTPEELTQLSQNATELLLGSKLYGLNIRDSIDILSKKASMFGTDISSKGTINVADELYMDSTGQISLQNAGAAIIKGNSIKLKGERIISDGYVTASVLDLYNEKDISIGSQTSDLISALSLNALTSNNSLKSLSFSTPGMISLSDVLNMNTTFTTLQLKSQKGIKGNGHLLSLGTGATLSLEAAGDVDLITALSLLSISGSYSGIKIANTGDLGLSLALSPVNTSGDFSLNVQGVLSNYSQLSTNNGITTIYQSNGTPWANVEGKVTLNQNGMANDSASGVLKAQNTIAKNESKEQISSKEASIDREVEMEIAEDETTGAPINDAAPANVTAIEENEIEIDE